MCAHSGQCIDCLVVVVPTHPTSLPGQGCVWYGHYDCEDGDALTRVCAYRLVLYVCSNCRVANMPLRMSRHEMSIPSKRRSIFPCAFSAAFPNRLVMRFSFPPPNKLQPISPLSVRAKQNAKRKEAAAAIVIQRWQRQRSHARAEAAAACEEASRRRWAVDKLHSAYAKRWRFEVSARRERRRKLEEEEKVRFRGAMYHALPWFLGRGGEKGERGGEEATLRD